jgi:carboxypeptidase C (cathepsin A)
MSGAIEQAEALRMRSTIFLFVALAGLSGAPGGFAWADEAPVGAAAASRDAKPERPESANLPADSTTAFTLNVGDRSLAFHVTAGSLQLKDEAGAPQAVVAYVAYKLDGADPERRPVTFAINGGPGAASAWLHLGALGPWRLPMAGLTPASPPTLVDNAETWLDFTDLVFVDPPGAGYSRIVASGDDARRRFWSVDGDVDGLAAAIRRWLTAERRLASPKFIVGESYGGFRAPRLAEALATDQGVGVAGLVLISPVLDLAALAAGPNDPFPLLSRLPSYAAAHRRRAGPVARADLAEVERYAAGDYLADWLRGPGDAAAVERMSQRVANLTGLDLQTVRRFAGRIDEGTFLREFERPQGKVVAFYDATIDAYDPFPAARGGGFHDPVLPGFEPAFASAIVDLYERKLGWKVEGRYELLSDAVNHDWRWGDGLARPEALSALRRMLALDPKFRVLVAHGLTDVQAPYFATALELAQIPDFGPSGRLTLKVYPGGHMVYADDDSRRALRDDARRLIEGP